MNFAGSHLLKSGGEQAWKWEWLAEWRGATRRVEGMLGVIVSHLRRREKIEEMFRCFRGSRGDDVVVASTSGTLFRVEVVLLLDSEGVPLWTVVRGAFVVCDVVLGFGEPSLTTRGGDGLLKTCRSGGGVRTRILHVLKLAKLTLVCIDP